MTESNGILLLGRGDLTDDGKNKKVKEITYTDIARSLEPFQQARLVIFVDDEKMKMKILKSLYKII